jgi:AraC family transcriptional regulator, transcriptional activator FtrA
MRKPHLVALVAYDDLRTFEYSIAADIFGLKREGLGVDWYDTIVVSPDRGKLKGAGGIQVMATAPFDAIAKADTIVVPGWRSVTESPPEILLTALRHASKRRARIVSLCSGAFALGAAGLLDGKRATTHWMFAQDFQTMFPNTHFESDVLYVDEGRIITSAGSAAGLDACLHIVRQDYGASITNTIARRMVIAPHREGGQAQFVEAPVSINPGKGIGIAMDWARSRLHKPITVNEMAGRSAMSPRTFLRRFHEAAGMSPNKWLQQERVNRARQLLETTAIPFADVATQCGYDSVETFRSAFRRLVGVSPVGYRSRFTFDVSSSS